MKIEDYVVLFLAPFCLSLFFTPLVRLVALKKGLISYPRADRWHKHPTALLGGIGIYLASVAPAFFLHIKETKALGLGAGATLLFLVGLFDDEFQIRPYTKLFIQIIAGSFAIFSGIVLALPFPILSIPLTLFWIVGVTNSFNLLDNIDGLAAGIAVIASGMLFIASLIISANPFGIFALIIAGAALGFLPYNFNPAKIFMGDSGSMFLGYSLAVISIAGTNGRFLSSLFVTMCIPVLILAVPIFDTIFVMFVRKLQGKNIFEGGKDHTSHRLVTLGLSQRKTVLLLYAVSIFFGSIALLYTSKMNLFVITIFAFLGAVILLFFGLFLFEVTSYPDESKLLSRVHKWNGNGITILNNIFMYKRRIVEVVLDFCFIFIAYYSSYYLRFEGHQLSANLYLMKKSLVWVILIKMAAFFIFGMYRGLWRYISISDLITEFRVVSIGSVASVLFLTFAFRFQDFSRKVFFIDWLILLFLVMGSRILFRVLGEFFNAAQKGGKNVLIFGAGDTGEMVIREIKRNKALQYNAVGFIDDNHFKIGNRIQGVRVLGTREKIKHLVEAFNVTEMLIAVPSLDPEELKAIIGICEECGLPYRKIRGILDQ